MLTTWPIYFPKRDLQHVFLLKSAAAEIHLSPQPGVWLQVWKQLWILKKMTDKETQDIQAAIDAQDNHMLYEITELVDMGMKLTADNLQMKFYIGYNRAMVLINKFNSREK